MEYLNYAQLVLGPAGSGNQRIAKQFKTTRYQVKRIIKVINLDPAAEKFAYKCDVDIRELINVPDVMNKQKLGPNGALLFCMEYWIERIDWLEDKFEQNGEDIYYLFDCPGQLELYSHYDIMRILMHKLKKNGFSICSVFCLDCTFLQEQSKFISGNVLSLATMIQMELPHLTVMTKCDWIHNNPMLEKWSEGIEPNELVKELNPYMGNKMNKWNQLLISFVENYAWVEFQTWNINDEDSINAVLYNADTILQYFESQEPREDIYAQAENEMMPVDEGNEGGEGGEEDQ